MIREKTLKVGVLTFCAVMTLACASNAPQQAVPEDDLAMRSSDAPLGPPNIFSADRNMESGGEVVIKTETQQGFEGTVEKMLNNRMTLYWRDKNSYTYSIGDAFEAKYKPDDGLTLLDETNPANSLVCEFSLSGDLNTGTDKFKAQQKACADLMFTFDSELTD